MKQKQGLGRKKLMNKSELIMMTLAEVQELEQLRKENAELKKQISAIYEAAKAVHAAVTELDGLICL